jgi:hypothetical protein
MRLMKTRMVSKYPLTRPYKQADWCDKAEDYYKHDYPDEESESEESEFNESGMCFVVPFTAQKLIQ